jgi:hypothetical protein
VNPGSWLTFVAVCSAAPAEIRRLSAATGEVHVPYQRRRDEEARARPRKQSSPKYTANVAIATRPIHLPASRSPRRRTTSRRRASNAVIRIALSQSWPIASMDNDTKRDRARRRADRASDDQSCDETDDDAVNAHRSGG